jgi:hypothetical protein
MVERRRNMRFPLRLYGQLSFYDGEYQDTETLNISLRGAYVEHRPSGVLGRSCILTLFAGGEDVFSVTFDGLVVHEHKRACGIEFQSVDRMDFEAFEEFLEKHIAEPAAVRREVSRGQLPALQNWVFS